MVFVPILRDKNSRQANASKWFLALATEAYL